MHLRHPFPWPLCGVVAGTKKPSFKEADHIAKINDPERQRYSQFAQSQIRLLSEMRAGTILMRVCLTLFR